jgi:hypothetical protein
LPELKPRSKPRIPSPARWRKWIIALSCPGYLALAGFGTIAWLDTMFKAPERSLAWDLVLMPVGLIGVASWGFGPIFVLIALVVFVVDLWRHRRPRRERSFLALLIFGALVAWIGSNVVNDKFHLLR